MIGAVTLTEVIRVYQGSDGDATKALYIRLEALGIAGDVAVNLFRAQKASERAKVYRGRQYRAAAYDRKQWSMDNLCAALSTHAAAAGIAWGWGEDPATIGYPHVLYIELPTGQVSFHTAQRGEGPPYAGAWDGVKGQSADRILRWVGRLLDGALQTEAAE